MPISNTKISSILDSSTAKYILKFIKYLLILGLGYILYGQILSNAEIIDPLTIFDGSVFLPIGLLVFPLMIFNWGIEIVKWKSIVSTFEILTFNKAVKSILCGVSLAIVTPGRIGEYGGRLIGISKENRSRAIVANLISSISQNVANISIGLIGMVAYSIHFLNINYTTAVSLCSISALMLSILIFIYYRLDLVDAFFSKYRNVRFIDIIFRHTHFLSKYTRVDLSKILGLSFLRYTVYTCQYVILILVCGVTNDPIHALLGVTVIFFLQSGLPLPPMLSVLARGEMAIWIWSVFSTNITAILTATFLLWMINLVIPTLVGTIILWRSRLI